MSPGATFLLNNFLPSASFAKISRMKRRTDPKDVIARLAGDGQEAFTLADLRARFNLTAPQAQQLAYRLARNNLVRRVKRGLYAILEPADWHGGPGLGVDRYWAAAYAVRGEAYYLAYYTAMELHEMLQHPLRTVFVAVTKQHRPLTFGTARVRFVTLAAGKFFGEEDRRTAQGHIVKVAQLERTVLDCADRPDLCGGIEEVFQGLVRRRGDLDPDRLLRFVHRLDKPVVTKRLGLLLELAGGDPELLLELERAAGRLKRFVPLDKMAPINGAERNRRWELIVNVELHRLFAAART
jgi:predicted transcriptional regulator of viral defense system